MPDGLLHTTVGEFVLKKFGKGQTLKEKNNNKKNRNMAGDWMDEPSVCHGLTSTRQMKFLPKPVLPSSDIRIPFILPQKQSIYQKDKNVFIIFSAI